MAKSSYLCVLYERGDKVKSKFKDLFDKQQVYEVEDTELKYVGIFPTLFLKLVGKPRDITDLSNYFVPADETIEKYKDGLIYFNEAKVLKAKKENSVEHGTRVHTLFARQLKKKDEPIDLTDETIFKTRVLPRGTFTTKPPIKKNDE